MVQLSVLPRKGFAARPSCPPGQRSPYGDDHVEIEGRPPGQIAPLEGLAE